MIMTSWSTSGIYSTVFESSTDIADLYSIRHVYPLSGFNILFDAFKEGVNSKQPLNIDDFIQKYCKDHFGFNQAQSISFWTALKTAPYEIKQGEVAAPTAISIQQLLDSNRMAVKALYALKPIKNQEEYEHFKLMTDIRNYYLQYQVIEKQVNDTTFNDTEKPVVLEKLKTLLASSEGLNTRFNALNKGFLNASDIAYENEVRNIKVINLYNRLARKK
jgi:hypothetical protein